MKNDIKRYIREKKVVFRDFGIPWDTAIEDRFKDELTKHPNYDPEATLDRLTHDIIMRKLGVI